ncbi:MAG: type I-D CRISPR-associated protein Cas5/Csc1 [Clostridia bacterium]|nr:MAG: type I-D CRISPR-associated protein Cas5/Csc1 [Clostridia bacterium]
MEVEVRCYLARLQLHENTFFASREIFDYYETEPVIGNVALAYALGFCRSPYHQPPAPLYARDLEQLNQRGIYVTPATPAGRPAFAIQSFNANSDSYWFQFRPNAVAVSQAQEARAVNYPQHGRLKMLAVGSMFTFYVMLPARGEEISRPGYVRLGKFNSKARVQWREITWEPAAASPEKVARVLSPLDFPENVTLGACDIVHIRPAVLVKNARLTGPGLRVRETGEFLPWPMRFALPGKE